MIRAIFAILALTFAISFAQSNAVASVDGQFCNGQKSSDSWGDYYPNGQEVKDSWGSYYPNGVKIKDNWGSYYINKQKHRDSWGVYYPNGKKIKDSWGIYYPNEQKIRDNWGCYNADGSDMTCRDVIVVRIQATPDTFMKMRLNTRTGHIVRLEHEIESGRDVTTLVDVDIEAGQVLYVDAVCGGPFHQ